MKNNLHLNFKNNVLFYFYYILKKCVSYSACELNKKGK